MARMQISRRKPPSSKIVDMVGRRYGRLVVVAAEASDRSRAARWACLCDCRGEGSEFVYGAGRAVVRGASLRSGATLSCGCLAREATLQRAKDRPKAEPKPRAPRAKRIAPTASVRVPVGGATGSDWRTFKDKALERALADLKR